MSKKNDLADKAVNSLGLGETHPIFVAVPVGIVTGIVTLSIYRYYMGSCRQPEQKRAEIETKLAQALQTVKDLESKMLTMEQADIGELRARHGGKEIRIWMDGAFDMMHYGHMNAFRQARSLGTHLIVGVNSDETITACKGPPVCPEKERIATVRGCKWVDEVVAGVPYVMSDEYLRYVIDKYNIDYVVHGDDPCIVDGKDVYESAVRMGKYLTIPRTEGISTTDIVGRMLLMTRDHHATALPPISEDSTADAASTLAAASPMPHSPFCLASSAKVSTEGSSNKSAPDSPVPFVRTSRFLTTSRTIRLFGAGVTVPKATDRVVYLAGAWDMFHAGHIAILEQARQLGDYVIVGVHNDSEVNQRRGNNLPIMNLHERVLSVLGCKWVDDVLIDAPYVITEEMIQSLRISVVVTGSVPMHKATAGWNSRDTGKQGAAGWSSSENSDSESTGPTRDAGMKDGDREPGKDTVDAFRVPREMGILQQIFCEDSDCGGVLTFVQRIQNQRKRFTEKYQKKSITESQYYTDKYQKKDETPK